MLAEEITLLWQTDEIRSKRPRVVDEIRQGLWFFEQSFWNAIPELERALGERLASAGEALRFGSWIGGDLDGNPNVGPETIEDALERARQLARELYRGELPARGGVGDVDDRDRPRSPSSATPTSRSALRSSRLRAARSRRLPGRSEPLADLDDLDALLRAHRGQRVADGRLADLRARARTFGLHLAKLDLRVHASAVRARRSSPRDAGGSGAAQARHGVRPRPADRLHDPNGRRRAAAEELAREAGPPCRVCPARDHLRPSGRGCSRGGAARPEPAATPR